MKTPNHWSAVSAITGKGCLLFALVLALLPSSLKAECAQWNVAIDWGLQQSDGILVHMELNQERGGTHLSGRASYSDKIHAVRQQGDVKGTVQGNKFDLRVVWKTGNVGNWNGTILPSGVIQGRCSDENVRSYKATFVSDRPMICVPPPPTTQLPTPPSLTDNIKPGSLVILQSLPRHDPDRSHELVVGQTYKVIGRIGGTLSIRGPSGRLHHLGVSSVQLTQ